MRLRYTRLALADLDEAWAFVAEQNPSAADALIARIRTATDGLATFPERDRQGRIEGTRELVVSGTPFVVAYRVRPREIEVLAIMHGARRWPDSL